MEQKYAWIFIDAWNEVLSSFCSKQILTADVLTSKAITQPSDISVIIGMVGDIDGQIFLSMDGETGQILASEMLGGMDVTGMEDVVKSAVGELCNMIMGSACSGISTIHKVVDITPPTIMTYEEAIAVTREPTFNISIVLEDLGVVDFDVSISA
jgi:chemotaxis protein CheX